MTCWIKANNTAQLIGLLAHEYGYSLSEIAQLTPFQAFFLAEYAAYRRRRGGET